MNFVAADYWIMFLLLILIITSLAMYFIKFLHAVIVYGAYTWTIALIAADEYSDLAITETSAEYHDSINDDCFPHQPKGGIATMRKRIRNLFILILIIMAVYGIILAVVNCLLLVCPIIQSIMKSQSAILLRLWKIPEL